MRPMPPVPARIRHAWGIAALVLLASAGNASAHAGSVAFWRVVFHATDARSEILVSLDDVSGSAPGVIAEAGDVPVERLGSFGEAILRHFIVLHQSTPAPSRILGARVLPSGLLELQVLHRLAAGASPVALHATFHDLTDDSHRVIARVERGAVVASLVFTVATPRHALPDSGRASWRDAVAPAGSVRAMLLLGIAHILTGYDHLVFLACLLIPGGTWRSRIAIVSAFTVAHSLTLGLAAMQVVTPPAHFVELAIAVSIAYVAIENLLSGPAGPVGRGRGDRRTSDPWPRRHQRGGVTTGGTGGSTGAGTNQRVVAAGLVPRATPDESGAHEIHERPAATYASASPAATDATAGPAGTYARWPVAFAFGLVHGLGFAGGLDVLDLPVGQWLAAVLAFNLGVEIGQLAVVAIALPVVLIIAGSSWHRRVVQYTSLAVVCLATVWFIERLP